MEFRWRADDGPLLWYLDPLSPHSPHQLKRHEISENVVRVKTFWIPTSAKRERERERERAYGARETFSHNFDFYVVQTAERVYVIVM